MKPCKDCGKEKPLSDFPIEKTHADGHQNFCKECLKKRNKKYYDADPEKSKAATQRWRAAHPEQVYDQHKAWVEANLERRREQTRIAHADWCQRNPEIIKARRAVNKATKGPRKTYSEDVFTFEEWVDLCEKSEYKCVCCKQEGDIVPDHIVPLIHGGCSHIHNIQPLCSQCNGRKGTKVIDYRALHDKHDVRRENLAALCQRCHLGYDMQDHIENARKTRQRKKREQAAMAGQLSFL